MNSSEYIALSNDDQQSSSSEDIRRASGVVVIASFSTSTFSDSFSHSISNCTLSFNNFPVTLESVVGKELVLLYFSDSFIHSFHNSKQFNIIQQQFSPGHLSSLHSLGFIHFCDSIIYYIPPLPPPPQCVHPPSVPHISLVSTLYYYIHHTTHSAKQHFHFHISRYRK